MMVVSVDHYIVFRDPGTLRSMPVRWSRDKMSQPPSMFSLSLCCIHLRIRDTIRILIHQLRILHVLFVQIAHHTSASSTFLNGTTWLQGCLQAAAPRGSLVVKLNTTSDISAQSGPESSSCTMITPIYGPNLRSAYDGGDGVFASVSLGERQPNRRVG